MAVVMSIMLQCEVDCPRLLFELNYLIRILIYIDTCYPESYINTYMNICVHS